MEDIKEMILNNILTTGEASEILNLGKSRLSLLSKSGELKPIKKTSNGSIYLRADVEDYKNKKTFQTPIDARMEQTLFCETDQTHLNLQFFRENRHKLDEIIAIYIYFCDFDAVLENFYFPSKTYRDGFLRYLDCAHMVLRDCKGREMWLSGCNCGYNGTGPSGTERILQLLREEGNLNAEQFTDEYIRNLKLYRVVTMYEENEETKEWVVNKKRDSLLPTHNRGGSLYSYLNNLVFIQDKTRMNSGTATELIENYQAFIPNPVEVRVFPTLEMAKEAGYMVTERGRKNVYNVIVIDDSNRQIWLRANINEKNFYKNSEVKDILESCGFDPEEFEEGKLGEFFGWLNKNLRIRPIQPQRYVK